MDELACSFYMKKINYYYNVFFKEYSFLKNLDISKKNNFNLYVEIKVNEALYIMYILNGGETTLEKIKLYIENLEDERYIFNTKVCFKME